MRGAGQECQDSHLWYGPMELPQPGGVNNINNINIEPAVQQVTSRYIPQSPVLTPFVMANNEILGVTGSNPYLHHTQHERVARWES